MTSPKMRLLLPVVAAVFMSASFAEALPVAPIQMAEGATPNLVQEVRAGGHGGHGGYHGGHNAYHGGHNVYHGGGNVYRGGHNVYRGGHNTVVVGGRGAWGRGYRWAPGGAIAAGAAIGFVAAASAAAYATTRPPAPGLCWYYTDPSQRSGFWDVCP
jgi:hypothetical protein